MNYLFFSIFLNFILHAPQNQDDTTSALELAIKQQQEQQPRVLINSNSNVQLADSKLGRTPSVVLNPALHSAAGNVAAIYSPNNGAGRGASAREKEIQQQYPTAPTLTTSGSDNERCSSQNSIIAAPLRQPQQSKKKRELKEQVLIDLIIPLQYFRVMASMDQSK